MDNILNMVNYYKKRNNIDDSIVNYLIDIIGKLSPYELIILEIELLYIEEKNKLVNILVNNVNNKLNYILKDINLGDLVILTDKLHKKVNEIEINNESINLQDLVNDKNVVFDIKLIDKIIHNNINAELNRNKNNNLIKSINIWLANLDNSINKKLNGSLEELINGYLSIVEYINNSEYINKYLTICSSKIDKIIYNSNTLDIIINVIPVLNKMYSDNYNKDKKMIKLLDYYIDSVDSNIKKRLFKLDYTEKLVLKDKINTICYGILNNNSKDDDFKVMIINNYLIYL